MANNIQSVQQCYAEFGKGNIQGIRDLVAEDVTWVDPGYPDIPFSARRQGKPEVLNFFTKMADTLTYTHFEPQRYFNDGDTVIAKGIFTGKGNATGKTFDSDWALFWEVVDGKVKHFQAFSDTVAMANALR
jgi:ketosteroid isomerase-like protein